MRAWLKPLRCVVALGFVTAAVGCSQTGTPDQPNGDPGQTTNTPSDPTDPSVSPNPGNPAQPQTTALTGALAFSDKAELCDGCSTTELSIKTLRELHVHSLWKGVTAGQHVELRKYYSPDGALYYQKLVAFDTEASAPRTYHPTQSLPHTRYIQPTVSTAAGEQAVSDYLLVGGTWITRHHMVGKWRVESYLDKLAGKPDIVGEFTLADETAPTP